MNINQQKEFKLINKWLTNQKNKAINQKDLSGVVFEPNINYKNDFNSNQDIFLENNYCIARNKLNNQAEVYVIPNGLDNLDNIDNFSNVDNKPGNTLGEGLYSIVKEIYTESGQRNVIKVFRSNEINLLIENELNILGYMGYLHDAFQTKTLNLSYQQDTKICFIIDFFPGATLSVHHNIKDASLLFGSKLGALHAAHDLLLQLKKLHVCGFVHRDIREDNILYDLKSRAIKLIDFGVSVPNGALCRQTNNNGDELSYTYAPEVHAADRNNVKIKVTYSMDIYSLGIIFRDCFFQLHQIPEFKKLIKRMLSPKPKKRPCLDELITACNYCMEKELMSIHTV